MNRARTAAAALFRRVFLINGLIFVLGTLILAVSPATVSSRIKLTEIPVLVVGLAIMLTANALLLRRSLAPMLKWERTTASASALAAQENERQRIARELHDEIGQTLTVALLILKRAVDRAPDEIRDELSGTQEAVRAGLDEVRSIARRLRPDALEDLGLQSALYALCTEFTRGRASAWSNTLSRSRIGCLTMSSSCAIASRRRGLTNIVRHAEAEQGLARSAHHERPAHPADRRRRQGWRRHRGRGHERVCASAPFWSTRT